jgi:hypothetical protein
MQSLSRLKRPILFTVLNLAIIGINHAQSTLSIDQIMQGEDFVGYSPERIEWSEDSKTIYFSWNPDQDTIRATYKVGIENKEIGKCTFEELKTRSENGDYTRDFSYKVYEKSGDLFLMDLSDYSTVRITNTLERESGPVFSGDGRSIIFRKENNLYQWERENGTTTQLTNFQKGSERKRGGNSAQDEWLEQDQLAYFEVLQDRKDQRKARQYRRDQIQMDRPKAIYLGNQNLWDLAISPDMNYVVYLLYQSADDKNTKVPNYVTESGYTEDLNARSKVGGPQSTYETWIYNRKADSVYQIETKDIPGIYDKPVYKKEYAADPDQYKDQYEEPREVLIRLPEFSTSGNAVVNITSQDYKDRWIMSLELSTGKLNLIDRQHDEAWIGGPGVGWFAAGDLGWIDDEHIWFISEKTGYAHLYRANVSSGKIKALTKGEYEVLDVQLSRDRQTFYLTTNEVSPHQQHFYH